MADPTIRIRLEDAGSNGAPNNAPVPGRGPNLPMPTPGSKGTTPPAPSNGNPPVPGRGVGLPMPGKSDNKQTLTELLGITPSISAMLKAGLGVAGVKLSGDAISGQARDLSKYSPELSMAKANSDLRNMQAEMNRAQTLGPNLAKFERRWNEMMNQFYEMGTRILDALLKLIDGMGPVWDFFMKVGERIIALIELSINGWQMIRNVFDPKKLKELAQQRDEIIDRIINGLKPKDDQQMADYYLKLFDQIVMPDFKAGA